MGQSSSVSIPKASEEELTAPREAQRPNKRVKTDDPEAMDIGTAESSGHQLASNLRHAEDAANVSQVSLASIFRDMGIDEDEVKQWIAKGDADPDSLSIFEEADESRPVGEHTSTSSGAASSSQHAGMPVPATEKPSLAASDQAEKYRRVGKFRLRTEASDFAANTTDTPEPKKAEDDDDMVSSSSDGQSRQLSEAGESEFDGSGDEELSDISDDFDIRALAVSSTKKFITREDEEMERVIELAAQLRDRPFLPPDPHDANCDFELGATGVALPPAHCAFKGCPRVFASESELRCHVVRDHLHGSTFPIFDWEVEDWKAQGSEHPTFLYYDYYERAVQYKAEQRMPDVNTSVQRRALENAVEQTQNIRSLICLACDQVHLDSGREDVTDISLTEENSVLLHDIYTRSANPEALTYNFCMKFYKANYAEGSTDNPWRHNAECLDSGWEWRRRYRFNVKGVEDMEMLCNPEDIRACAECAGNQCQTVCRHCAIPLCRKCKTYLRYAFSKENLAYANHCHQQRTNERRTLPYCIPMALVNDNMFGYTSSLIARYRVRWIEMAAVLPIWTTMMVYYVEGDYGHLMNEEYQKPRWRTKVHGHCFSFIMPWEQVVRDLLGKVTNKDLKLLPHDEECLTYMLSVHLKVAGRDFHQHLKQVHLRPFVLVLLLCDLIDRGHPVFDHSLSAQVLKAAVKQQVEARYPETEAHLPEDERNGHIPPQIQRMMDAQCSSACSEDAIPVTLRKMVTIHYEKNAVPDGAAASLEDALEDVRPSSLQDIWPSSVSLFPGFLRHLCY